MRSLDITFLLYFREVKASLLTVVESELQSSNKNPIVPSVIGNIISDLTLFYTPLCSMFSIVPLDKVIVISSVLYLCITSLVKCFHFIIPELLIFSRTGLKRWRSWHNLSLSKTLLFHKQRWALKELINMLAPLGARCLQPLWAS